MPVLRYFVFVGGALLALLFVCDAVVPQIPLPATLKSGSDLPTVRIHSERRWPERVVIDTTVPTVAPVKVAKADAPKADTGQEAATPSDTQKAKVRDAYAQIQTAEAKTATSVAMAGTAAPKTAEQARFKMADATAPRAGESKSELSRPEAKPKRKVAKVHPQRPMMLVAQQPQPHFGFFDFTW
ncbi:hypothetical protein [Bradyrhizobium sp. STM 3557]|uniref:hypothetical protein n=1 Tax=Bradyrhizobium sp. STM 3557 TaxID=578920 RepID=UPI00389009EF